MKTIAEATGGAIKSDSPVIFTASIAGPVRAGERIRLYCYRDEAYEEWTVKRCYVWSAEKGDDLEISATSLRGARLGLRQAYRPKEFDLRYE